MDGERMDETRRGEYVTYREHITAKEEAAKVLGAIQLEQAAQRAALMHLPEDVRRLTDAVNAMGNRVAAPVADPNALAIHHAAAAMTEAVKALANRPTVAQEVVHAMVQSKAVRGGSVWPWVVTGAAIAVAAFMGWHQLTGH